MSLVFLISGSAAGQDLYDVSILLPKPDSRRAAEFAAYLRPDFSPSLLEGFGTEILPAIQSNAATFEQLRAVAFRLDLLNQEFRIVWQPFAADGSKGALDAGVHTIYSTSREVLAGLARELHRLRGSDAPSVVSESEFELNPIHPELRAGLASAFYPQFLKLIAQVMRPESLARIAITGVRGNNNGWIFQALDRAAGPSRSFTRAKIPKTLDFDGASLTEQRLVNFKPDRAYRVGMFLDEVFGDQGIGDGMPVERLFFKDSDEFVATRSRVQLNQVATRLLKLNQPRMASPKNTDCFSCHAVDGAVSLIDRTTGATSLRAQPRIPGNLRMFGYFGDQPAVAKRTVLDSIESLRFVQ